MILEVKKWPPGGAGILLSLKTWNFRYFLVDFDEFLPIFWWFFGISSAHFGTLTQCSVDPRCASSAYLKTSRNISKHLRNFEKLSETLKKSHETSRKWIFFEFRPISMNFQMYQNQKQSKCVLYNFKFSQKRKYRFYSWKKGKPTAPSVPRRSPIQVLTRLNVA